MPFKRLKEFFKKCRFLSNFELLPNFKKSDFLEKLTIKVKKTCLGNKMIWYALNRKIAISTDFEKNQVAFKKSIYFFKNANVECFEKSYQFSRILRVKTWTIVMQLAKSSKKTFALSGWLHNLWIFGKITWSIIARIKEANYSLSKKNSL